jgi:hypothetical protein
LGFQVSELSLVLVHPPRYGLCISSQFFHENPQVKVALWPVIAAHATSDNDRIAFVTQSWARECLTGNRESWASSARGHLGLPRISAGC